MGLVEYSILKWKNVYDYFWSQVNRKPPKYFRHNRLSIVTFFGWQNPRKLQCDNHRPPKPSSRAVLRRSTLHSKMINRHMYNVIWHAKGLILESVFVSKYTYLYMCVQPQNVVAKRICQWATEPGTENFPIQNDHYPFLSHKMWCNQSHDCPLRR